MTDKEGPQERCERSVRISNETGKMDIVILEPWGDEVAISAGDVVDILAVGPMNGALLETETIDAGMVVWAWAGTLLDVRLNGVSVHTAASKISPPKISGGTVKEFLALTKLVSVPYERPKRS
jgi:hypothetical protein